MDIQGKKLDQEQNRIRIENLPTLQICTDKKTKRRLQ
jgi:hypothetical protein